MIVFKKTFFVAQLKDLGYGGKTEEPRFIGRFTNEAAAMSAAVRAMKGRSSHDVGEEPEVVEDSVDIEIYESLREYLACQARDAVEAAKAKLSKAELKALTSHLRKQSDQKRQFRDSNSQAQQESGGEGSVDIPVDI